MSITTPYPVFPLNPDKTPATGASWIGSSLPRDEWPDGDMWGIETGHDVFVVDWDSYKGDLPLEHRRFADLFDGRTFTVRTRSGGQHAYFNMVDGITNAGGIPGLVDIRGRHGYVVSADSEGYSIEHDVPVADAPEWLTDRLLLAVREREVADIPESDRTADELAADLPAGLVDAYLRDDVDDRSGHIWFLINALQRDGWPAADTLTVMTACPAVLDKAVPLTSLQRQVSKAYGDVESPSLPVEPSGQRKSLADLMSRKFAPLTWVVPGIIPEGTTLIAAAPKIGKSWLAYDIALACAMGGKALGAVPVGKSRPVLYLDMESGDRRIQSRMSDLGVTAENVPARFEFHTDKTTALDEAERFMSEHKGESPLLVVDTLAAIQTARTNTQNQYNKDYETLAFFQRMTREDPGAAAIIVHHTKKGAVSDPLEGISGTNGLAGAADTPIILDRADRHSPEATLNVMARDFEGGEFAVRWDESSFRWKLDGDTLAQAAQAARVRAVHDKRTTLGDDKLAVLAYVEEHGEVTVEQVASGVEDLKREPRKLLAELANSGYLERPHRGIYRAVAI